MFFRLCLHYYNILLFKGEICSRTDGSLMQIMTQAQPCETSPRSSQHFLCSSLKSFDPPQSNGLAFGVAHLLMI